MMQASISLTSCILIVAALATVAVAAEGNTYGARWHRQTAPSVR